MDSRARLDVESFAKFGWITWVYCNALAHEGQVRRRGRIKEAAREVVDCLCELNSRISFADSVRELGLRLANLHADNLGAVEAIDMLNHLFERDFAVQVAHHLMDVRENSAVGQ
jgi:hypothetical protein